MTGSFGKNLRVTMFGENNSDAIGFVMEGLSVSSPVDLGYVRQVLERRRKMYNQINPDRPCGFDTCRVLSGYKEGTAIGTPLTIMIENNNQESRRKEGVLRPSMPDYGAIAKCGSAGEAAAEHISGRMNTAIAAAGAIARRILQEEHGIQIGAHILNIGKVMDKSLTDEEVTPILLEKMNTTAFPTLSPKALEEMREEIKSAQREGQTLGGSVECVAVGLPPGVGEPLFASIQANISTIAFGLFGVCGIEFGLGFALCHLNGERANDAFFLSGGSVKKRTNHSGGVTGGMTDGSELCLRVGFGPAPGILKEQETVHMKTGKSISYTYNERGIHGNVCTAFSEICAVEGAVSLAILDLLL